jgi:voltage-gated potassium channel Kch
MRRLPNVAQGALGSPYRNLASILLFMAIVCVVATLAYMRAGWSFADASYMVTLTIYTVGYGEVRPIDTPYLHAVTMSTMVFGCTGMILLTSALVQVFTAMQLRAYFGADRMQRRIDELSDHVIICGFGRIGVMLARELNTAGRDFVIVERAAARIAEAEAAGYVCLSGEATDEAVMIAAGIARAKVLATVLPDDAANVFITLSARSLNPGIEIIARGEAPTTEGKLRHAGADKVVLPTHIGAERIAELILYPHTAGVLRNSERMREIERAVNAIGLEMEMVVVPQDGALTGALVAEAERRGGGRFMIVQVNRRDGEIVADPPANMRIEAGDGVALVIRGERAAAAALFAAPAEPIRVGRNTF